MEAANILQFATTFWHRFMARAIFKLPADARCQAEAPRCRIKLSAGASLPALFFLGFLVVVSAPSAWARVENPHYLIRHWATREGMPDNSALALAQTSDGYIWVGSSEGLSRFNGKDFKRADELQPLPFLGSVVRALQVDHAGRLWLGAQAGVGIKEGATWRQLTTTNLELRSVDSDSAGHTLLGTHTGRVFEYRDGELRELAPPAGMTKSGVFICTDAKDETLWVANRGFIGRWSRGAWERVGPPAPNADSLVAAPARDGGLWVYEGDRLYHYRVGQPTLTRTVVVVDQPRQILEDRRGRIWIVSNSAGLTRLNTDGPAVFISAKNGLADNTGWCLAEDSEGDLWFGTSNGGLHRLRERLFQQLGYPEGLPNSIVRSVTEAGPGRILVGTHGGGTARIESNHVVWVHPPSADPGGRRAWSVLRDRGGRLWTGTYEGGLLVDEQGVEREFPLPTDTRQAIYALFEDRLGRLWVGTHRGVRVIENGELRLLPELAPLTNCVVRGLAEDRQSGAFWIATHEHGLFRLAGGKLTSFGPAQGLPGLCINSVTLDDDGCVWVGVHGFGIVRIRDDKLTKIGAEKGLMATTIGSLLDDAAGSFWMGSDQGILRVSKPELHRLAQGETSWTQFTLYDESDGLDTAGCSSGYQPAAVRDAAGKMWFATFSGVVTFDPSLIPRETNGPLITIEHLQYLDSARKLHELAVPPARLDLPPGASELDVQFSALSFATPEKIRYAIRLEPPDRDWVPWGNRPQIHFHSIDPGLTTLRVRAANRDGSWSQKEARLIINVQPLVIQRTWFRALALLLVAAGIVGGLLVAQRRNMLRQKAELAAARKGAAAKTRLVSILEGATERLQKSENALRAFMDSLPAPAFMVGRSGELRAVNAALSLDLKRPRQKLVGQRLEQLFPSELAVARQSAVDRVFEGEPGFSFEDSREGRHFINYLSPVPDADDGIAGVALFSLDITDRKKEEQQALLLAQTLKSARDCIAVTDLSGNILFVNEAFLLAYGYTQEEITGKNLTTFRGSQNPGEDPVASALPGLSGTWHGEINQRRKDGREFPIELWTSVVRDSAGQPIASVGVARDITERREIECVRRRMQELLRSVVENTQDLITIVDATGTIRFSSASCETVLGLPRGQVVDHDSLEFIHPDDAKSVREVLAQILDHPESAHTVEYRVRHATGSWRTVESIGRRLVNEASPMILISTRDLTDRRRLEERLLQAQKMEALGQLSGGVAHDFNNLLTVIMGHVVLLRERTDLPGEVRDSISEIGDGAVRAANLTRQLLTFSSRQVLQPGLLNLNEVILNFGKILRRILGEDVKVQLNLCASSVMIKADPSMLDQVLLNLAVNSRDAMPVGGEFIIATTEQTISASEVPEGKDLIPGRFACLTISDTGCGMTEEVKSRIFEPFFTTKDPGKGTGLGLATVFGIVKQHAGIIRVTSEVGQGTTFQILLPASNLPPVPRLESPAPSTSSRGKETILLVEDEVAVRKLTGIVLRGAGYEVLEAENGPLALTVWEQHSARIQLLFTDMIMPGGMGGSELAEKLQTYKPQLKVVFTSGYSIELAGRAVKLAAGQAFVPKPSDPRKILETIRQTLDGPAVA